MQEQKATWIPVEGAKPSPGQMVRVEVAPLDERGAGAAQPYDLVLGQNQAIPDLEERIMTLLPGEQADAEVKFPDDHPDESRRGQTRRVRVTLHDVKRQELPAARRRVRARGRRLREPRRAARGGPAGPGARGRPRGRRPGPPGAGPADRRGQQRAGARVAGAPADARLRRDVPGARRSSSSSSSSSSTRSPRRRSGATWCSTRWSRPTASGPPRRSSTSGWASWPAARGVPAGQLYGNLQKANRLPELERAITEEKVFDWLLQQSTIDEVKS